MSRDLSVDTWSDWYLPQARILQSRSSLLASGLPAVLERHQCLTSVRGVGYGCRRWGSMRTSPFPESLQVLGHVVLDQCACTLQDRALGEVLPHFFWNSGGVGGLVVRTDGIGSVGARWARVCRLGDDGCLSCTLMSYCSN